MVVRNPSARVICKAGRTFLKPCYRGMAGEPFLNQAILLSYVGYGAGLSGSLQPRLWQASLVSRVPWQMDTGV